MCGAGAISAPEFNHITGPSLNHLIFEKYDPADVYKDKKVIQVMFQDIAKSKSVNKRRI